MKKLSIFLLLFCIFKAEIAFSQCSDAGICSIAKNTSESRPLFLGLTYDYGYSGKQDNIFINDLKLAINYQVTSRLGLSAALPFTKKIFNNADYSGSVQGIGDLTISSFTTLLSESTKKKYHYEGCFLMAPSEENNPETLWRTKGKLLQLDVAIKLATGSINKNQLSLRYQTGLGSNDLLLGISYVPAPDTESFSYYAEPEYWKFGFGFQIPFGITPNTMDSIRRGPDLVGSITYFNAMPNLDYQIELLAIKRLTKTRKYFQGPFILTSEGSPDPIDILYGSYDIPKSDFFQINLRLSAKYYFAKDAGFLVGAAIPFLKRGENSDGLERSYTIFCGISYLFGGYR